MKKYIYFLILTVLSFIPILKVNALNSDTSTLVVNYYTNQDTENYWYKTQKWIIDNSSQYLNSIKNEYSYYLIFIQEFTPTNWQQLKGYYINIILDDTNNQISSDWRSSNPKGLYYNSSTSDKFIRLSFYQDYTTTNYKYYLDENMTTEITSLSDDNIILNETNKSYTINNSSSYNWIRSFTSSTATMSLNIIDTNMILSNSYFGSSYNRYLTYYDLDNQISHKYYIGDEILSYYKIINPIPDYLIGYEKVGLTPSDNTIIISNVSKGSIYISVEDFDKCNGLFGYFDKDLSSQPYSSVITEYTKTSDELYIRQDFDLSSYVGADYVYYQKCQYVDENDDIYKYIWVPNGSYTSPITSTNNNTGGLDYTYRVEENGEIVENTFSSLDNILDSNNPLLNTLFTDFSTNYFGISSIVTAPLSLINQLSSSTCSPLILPFPYSNENLVLPCMTEIYEENFGEIYDLYQFLLLGFVSYRIAVAFFYDIKKLKDPNNDEVEVINL